MVSTEGKTPLGKRQRLWDILKWRYLWDIQMGIQVQRAFSNIVKQIFLNTFMPFRFPPCQYKESWDYNACISTVLIPQHMLIKCLLRPRTELRHRDPVMTRRDMPPPLSSRWQTKHMYIPASESIKMNTKRCLQKKNENHHSAIKTGQKILSGPEPPRATCNVERQRDPVGSRFAKETAAQSSGKVWSSWEHWRSSERRSASTNIKSKRELCPTGGISHLKLAFPASGLRSCCLSLKQHAKQKSRLL